MASFSNIDGAYNNNDDLDKMARMINTKNRNKLIDNVFNSYTNDCNNLRGELEGISAMPEFGFFASNPQFIQNKNQQINGSGTLISDIRKDIDEQSIDSSFSSSGSNSEINISSDYDISVESPTIDSYIDILKKDKKKSKISELYKLMREIHREKCSSSDESIFEHMKHCKTCRYKLLKTIKNNHGRHNKYHNDHSQISEESLSEEAIKTRHKNNKVKNNINIGNMQLKEILIIALIGIFIIIILDLLMRSQRHN